jgi:hypothetical protein
MARTRKADIKVAGQSRPTKRVRGDGARANRRRSNEAMAAGEAKCFIAAVTIVHESA